MEMGDSASVALGGLCFLLAFSVWKVLVSYWWRPLQTKKFFEAQGVKCLPYHLLFGNMTEAITLSKEARSSIMPCVSHDILFRVTPQYYRWSKEYGSLCVSWLGRTPRLSISDPDLVREILWSKSGHFVKLKGRPDSPKLVGNGLATLEGEKWAQHRRIINPAFFMEKLKAMIPTIAACASEILGNWQRLLDADGAGTVEIDVLEECKTLTADIIAHTAFGTSYAEGKQVFELQHKQQLLLDTLFRTVYFPGRRFLPSPTNRYRRKLDNEVKKSLSDIVRPRLDSVRGKQVDFSGHDLLGLMIAANDKELEGNQKKLSMDMQDIIDECKTFFFAGHETTSNLLTWTLMLLAVHTEWQERARAEVLATCGTNPPDGDSLPHLKTVGMVLNESLRLYPPAALIVRRASKLIKLQNLAIPKDTVVVVHILSMHHDPKFWGADANEFNPQRFADGVANACKHPMAFVPFSVGPRNCVGQNFAMLEAKVVLSMILQRFCFRLSPGYKHAPTTVLTLQPQYGMQIIFQKAT